MSELLWTVIVAAMMAAVLLPFAGRGGGRRGFRDAPIGIGTVTSTRRTGLTVNDQPQLEITLDVDTPDGQSFVAVARHIVDLTELGAVEPGATLPVRYRPGDLGKVVLATDAAPAELQAAMNLVQTAKGHLDGHGLRLAQHGLDARGVVLAMTPTGEIRDDRPVLELTLRVTRRDGTRFDVTNEKTVPPALVPKVQPGSVVAVKYLPGDESQVALAFPVRS